LKEELVEEKESEKVKINAAAIHMLLGITASHAGEGIIREVV
jgi:hypothetical protein